MKIGMVTPGQSPRDDIVPEMETYLNKEVDILQAGALDDISKEEVAQSLNPDSDNDLLVTRMRDGSSVTVSEAKITPRVQHCVEKLEKEDAPIILVLCTGNFPTLQSKSLLIKAGNIFTGVVKNISHGDRVGVMIPNAAQAGRSREKWGSLGIEIKIVVEASPYSSMGAIEAAARRLGEEELNLIALDCLGYNIRMKELVRKITNKPVVLPRSILARVLAELL